MKVSTNVSWMTSLTLSSEIGGIRLELLVVSPSCCSSNPNSSDDVLDPTADHAYVQLVDCELVGSPLRKGDAYVPTSVRPSVRCM